MFLPCSQSYYVCVIAASHAVNVRLLGLWFAVAQALAISHCLKERGCFPPRVRDPTDVAQFFFQACAIEMSADQLAVVAATMAGVGKCPTTNKQCYSPDVTRTVLSVLYSCGMTTVSWWWLQCLFYPFRCPSQGGHQGDACCSDYGRQCMSDPIVQRLVLLQFCNICLRRTRSALIAFFRYRVPSVACWRIGTVPMCRGHLFFVACAYCFGTDS